MLNWTPSIHAIVLLITGISYTSTKDILSIEQSEIGNLASVHRRSFLKAVFMLGASLTASSPDQFTHVVAVYQITTVGNRHR